jgi:hypothetical protein
MTPQATVRRAIARAERILPGKPTTSGADPRWQAIIWIGYSSDEQPDVVWEFAKKWGKHPQDDLRDAVATVLLEHLLERHFVLLFPRVRDAALKSVRFTDTLRRCWWMGEAAWPKNAAALDRLVRSRRPRMRPKRPANRTTASAADSAKSH